MNKFFLNGFVLIALLTVFCCNNKVSGLSSVNSNSQSIDTSELTSKAFQNFYKADSLYLQAQFDSALFFYKKASLLYLQIDQREKYLKCQILISQSFQTKGIFDSAFHYLKSSEIFLNSKGIDSKKVHAEFFFIKGNLLFKYGEIDSSLKCLKLARDYCENEKYDSLTPLVYKSLGNLEISLKDNKAALGFYNKALSIERSRVYPSDITIASLYLNIGIANSNMGLYDSAKLYFNQSVLLKEKFLNKNDPQLASGYLNYGRFLYIMGESNESLNYLSKAEEIYISNFGLEYFGLAPIYFNIGSIFILLGDYNKALTYQEQALELYRKNSITTNSVINELYLNFGVIYEKLGNLQKAIEFYNDCLIDNFSPENSIKALRNSARCYFSLNDFSKAEENYKKAISISEKLYGKDSYHTAGSYSAYGQFCTNQKKYNEAVNLFNDALRIYKEIFGFKNTEVSLVLINLADLYYDMDKIEQALEVYQKAIVSTIKKFNDYNLYSNPSIDDIDLEFNNFIALYKKSDALYLYYRKYSHKIADLQASFEVNKLTIILFEKILSSYKDENTKLLINDYVYDIYNSIVLVATDLYEKTNDIDYLYKAFEFSEKGKAAILLSSLRQSEAIEIGKIPENIKAKEQNLNKEISLYKINLYDESQKSMPDSNKIFSLKKIIFEESLKYDSLIDHIENNYPDYFQLKYSVDVIEVKDIQQRLEKDEIFIEYKIVDSALLTFLISHDTVIYKKQIIEGNISEKVIGLMSLINVFPGHDFTKETYKDFIQSSYYFYKILLENIGVTKDHKSLLIVPDGILGYLTFEALLMDDYVPDKLDFRNLNYVINQYSVSYIYSATIMFKHNVKKKNNGKLLAMAPTYLNLADLNSEHKVSWDKFSMLTPLDYSIDEVNNISSEVYGKVVTGEEATEKFVKSDANKFKILHFAMHTLINDEDPLKSKLVFTLNNDSAEDGFLNNYEIYNLNLNAQLVVLSACKTGIGKFSKGEGIMSLARGFMYAGVPSIVMTLWEIEDISSANIMEKFYHNLNKGLNIDDALRNSKLTYITESDQIHSHPYFWAAYVQIGDNSTIITYSYRRYLIYPVAFLLILVTVYIGFRIYRKRKNIS
jgi:tetratricopeptide (TPR) repeat protein